MPLILGLESTCDETAAAVVRDGRAVLSNVVSSQADLHAKYRGVVPEIASRAHIENLLPVLRDALTHANLSLHDIDAISVTHRPGLIGSLLITVTAAKTLAWTLRKPLLAVDHVHAHLYSVMLQDPPFSHVPPALSSVEAEGQVPEFPAVGLVVSGGHTALYSLHSFSDVTLIGSTIDDAVGEAYDKVAAILGLGYPGGPLIDRLAQLGNPKATTFPRTLLDKHSLDFSFSGLKTSVLYHVRGKPTKAHGPAVGTPLTDETIRNTAASFQQAAIDTLLTKLKRAIAHTGAKSVIIGGGVSANAGLRNALPKLGIPTFLPPLKYCTDNAAMSAGLAHLAYDRRDFADLSLDAITHSQFRD